MWRRTEEYRFRASGRVGYFVLRPSRFNEYADQSSLPLTELGVQQVWAPRVNNISVAAFNFSTLTDPPTKVGPTIDPIELLAQMVDYETWKDLGRPNGTGPTGAAPGSQQDVERITLRDSTCQQPLAGWRAGDAGRRIFYANGARDDGYPFPRENVEGNADCISPLQGWWPLILTWEIPFLDNGLFIDGCFTVEWEWKVQEL